MKKIILTLAILFVGIGLSSTINAQTAITANSCGQWADFRDEMTEEWLSKIESPLLQQLYTTQQNTKTWVGYTKLDELSWDNILYIKFDNTKPDWLTKEWDIEYVKAVQACQEAMVLYEDLDAQKAYLKKAELHIENTINELKKVQTAKRMPFIHHGGILPGSTEKGDASDYVENKLIPKFVNGVLVLLISLSVLMLIIGGVMLLMAGGDSDSTARAKTIVMWSIAGVVITILSYAIVQFIIGIDFSL